MDFYLNDILTQPDELKNVLRFYEQETVKEMFEKLQSLNFSEIIWSGMGSSHFCSIPADIHLAENGIISRVMSTGELLHYETGRIKDNTVLCLISQSGESAEIVALLNKLSPDIKVIAVTNDVNSTLAKRGDVVLPLNVSGEKSVTTRTYLASVIITLFIAFTVTGEDIKNVIAELYDVCSKMEQYLKKYKTETEKLDVFSKDCKVISVMGRGDALTTVRAGSLFFREVARMAATDFDSAEFRHGPMEMVEEGFFSLVLAPSGKTQELNLKLAYDIADKGGRVVLISDKNASALKEHNNILLIKLPEVKECYSVFLEIIPIQLLADLLAKRKGITAGEFRWGSKITATE